MNFLKATSEKYFFHRRFLDCHGFVVVTNVMPEEENNKCIKGIFYLRRLGLLGVSENVLK